MQESGKSGLSATSSLGTGAREFGVRVAVFYGALFLVYGVHVPYLPLWLDWRGLNAQEIAIVMAAPFFLRLLVTPVVAMIADRDGNHRRMVQAIAWGALALALLLSEMEHFWPIFLVAVPFHVAVATIMPLTETIAVRGVRSSRLDYGRMRLWGSLTFIVIGLIGGALADLWGAAVCVYVIAAGAAATALASRFLPPDELKASSSAAPTRALIGPEVWGIMRSPLFLIFLLAVAAVQASHATFYSFGALHWKSQGIPAAWVGVLWAVAVVSEVALFAVAARIFARANPVDLIVAGGIAAAVRWGVMSCDPPLWISAPLQVLHALTYGASHLGAIHFIARAVPDKTSGTAQALYAVMASGAVMGAATLVSGLLYPALGGRTYLVAAGLGAVGLVGALVLKSRWQGGLINAPS